MTKHWETQPDGRVYWATDDIMKAHELGAANDYTERTESWGPLAARMARRHHVPLSWVLGVIYAETGGDPSAISPRGAVGLMQIMTELHATNTAAMLDPTRNVDKGCSILRRLMLLGLDLPEAASGYNAGLNPATQTPWSSSENHWGMREDTGYISRVVQANNYFVGRLEAGQINLKGPPVCVIGGLLVLASGIGLWQVQRLG